MKIIGIQFMGMQKIAILDNGEGVDLNEIDGNVSVGAGLELNDGKYSITSPIQEACSS